MDRRVVAVMLVVAAALGAGSGFRPAAAQGCPGVSTLGSWKRISTPLEAAAFTVDGSGAIYVAGDGALMTSRDRGCTWRQVLRLPGAPLEERVTAMTTVGEAVLAAVSGPRVLVSSDRGKTWTASSEGLDLPGEPVGLYPAASGPVVYMLVRQEVDDGALTSAGLAEQGVSALATVVYRSADAGRTWTRGDDIGTSYSGPHGADVEGGSAPGPAWDLAVDPDDPDHLFAAASDGVFVSVNGGDDWSPAVWEPGARFRAVAAGRGTAFAVDPLAGAVYESTGGAWRRTLYPQLRTEMMTTYPRSAAWAWGTFGAGGEVVVSGPKGIFRRAGASLVDVTPPGPGGVGDTAADVQVAGSAVWARLLDGSALLTEASGTRPGAGDETRGARTAPLPPVGEAAGEAGRALPFAAPAPERVELAAPTRRVTLIPGETRTVRYEARIGPRRVAVDLYFLVDTTASMSDTIRALVGGMGDVVTRLARSGIRLRAGVGSFRTYPRPTDRVDVDYPYRRERALGPVDADLLRSLYDLEGGGSSGANLTAVLQAVTGAGQDVLPPGPSNADVPPGRGAGFRDGALKVVMHLADTWFGTPDRGDPSGYYAPGTWPGPSFDAVAEALRAEDVLHLGIALQPGGGGTVLADADVVEDMRTLSRATSSLAGGRGADCDGDESADVGPGEPLVCLLDRGAEAGGMAAVVTGLVEALEQRGDVRLVEVGTSALVRRISPDVHAGVDLRAAQRLPFDVTVGCSLSEAGTRRSVRLGLVVAGERVAESALEVVCGELPAATLPSADAGRSAPALSLVPPIPVPPPPHPVPGPGPGSVTAPAPVQAPAPAQAPGGQPQGVSVSQPQRQPQAAFVVAVQQVREQTQMQHALVRTRARNPLESARLWTAVGGLSMLWAWGMATAVVTAQRRARA